MTTETDSNCEFYENLLSLQFFKDHFFVCYFDVTPQSNDFAICN